jgi:hypothetical protein
LRSSPTRRSGCSWRYRDQYDYDEDAAQTTAVVEVIEGVAAEGELRPMGVEP